MKRIIITESQYKRLLLSKKVIKEAMVSDIKGDIDIKGNELTNGGDISSEWEKILNDLDDMLDDAGIKYKITAGNDRYHQRKNTDSRHTIGCAVDFALRNRIGSPVSKHTFNRKYKDDVVKILKKLKNKYSSLGFKWLDEYNNPSEKASGKHIHMSIDRKYCEEYTPSEKPETSNIIKSKKLTIDDIIDNNDNSELIGLGSEGSGVEEIQTILDKLDYDLGEKGIDGIFGSVTKQAVEDYQKDNDLTVDGIVGIETSKSMEKENV